MSNRGSGPKKIGKEKKKRKPSGALGKRRLSTMNIQKKYMPTDMTRNASEIA
jgi:hypothetical protein